MNASEKPQQAVRATILIADDFAEWRIRVREILYGRPEWQIAEACDGSEAVKEALELRPELVLLDIGMPVLNGLKAAEEIRRVSPQSKIVFLTQESDADICNLAFAARAQAYVLKSDAARELLTTIAKVLGNGHSPLSRPGS